MIKFMSPMWEWFFFSIDFIFLVFVICKTPFGFLFSIGIDTMFNDNVSSDTFKSMFNVQQREPDSKKKLNIFNNRLLLPFVLDSTLDLNKSLSYHRKINQLMGFAIAWQLAFKFIFD